MVLVATESVPSEPLVRVRVQATHDEADSEDQHECGDQ